MLRVENGVGTMCVAYCTFERKFGPFDLTIMVRSKDK